MNQKVPFSRSYIFYQIGILAKIGKIQFLRLEMSLKYFVKEIYSNHIEMPKIVRGIIGKLFRGLREI